MAGLGTKKKKRDLMIMAGQLDSMKLLQPVLNLQKKSQKSQEMTGVTTSERLQNQRMKLRQTMMKKVTGALSEMTRLTRKKFKSRRKRSLKMKVSVTLVMILQKRKM